MSYTLKTKSGTLFNESGATFMVNSSNTRLILGSGVSRAFLRECGKELQAEMTSKLTTTFKQGDVVATTSGRSDKFEIALHACIMDYNPGVRDKAPTLQTIYDALLNIEGYLKWYASKYPTTKFKIAMPMMGCGTGKLPVDDVVKLYIDFFSKDVGFDCEVVVYHLNTNNYKMMDKLIV